MKVGFIGLGIMGSRMALNLQKKGHELVVYNRSRDKAGTLLAGGARWASSPADVAAAGIEVLVTMLSKPEIVREAALGKNGFLEKLPSGALWVDSSTVNPSFSLQMAAEAARRGVHFLDAPVAGSKVPAEKAQLLFLVGGDAADVEKARPLFDAMGRQVVHAGGHSAGAGLKMVNNLLLGLSMLAYAEALVLGELLGISRAMMLDALASSPVISPFLNGKRGKIETGNFEAEFPLQWLQKDLELASETAFETGAALPATSVAKEVYALAMRRGLAEKDLSAIYQFLSEKAGK